jgi:hypothetical protein
MSSIGTSLFSIFICLSSMAVVAVDLKGKGLDSFMITLIFL